MLFSLNQGDDFDTHANRLFVHVVVAGVQSNLGEWQSYFLIMRDLDAERISESYERPSLKTITMPMITPNRWQTKFNTNKKRFSSGVGDDPLRALSGLNDVFLRESIHHRISMPAMMHSIDKTITGLMLIAPNDRDLRA